MRLLYLIFLLILNLIFVNSRSITPSTTTTVNSLTTKSSHSTVEPKYDSIRYNVAESSQMEIQLDDSGEPEEEDDETEESQEAKTLTPTVDPAFVELSRQAFLHLNQGQQYVKPVVQTDEQRKLMWLSEHQSRKDKKDQLPGKRQVMTLTSVDNLDRNQTCYGERFKHKIRMAGCQPKIIINTFCHGACSSFYVPKLRSKKLKATFKSCAACVPVETDYVKVQLDCPDRPETQMFRTVVRVKSCACRNIQFGNEDDEDY
ncbi:Bursicon [Aphelenchoides bicaudatus]|nr:Bursicon [Aphelenchoides bicaudatus]